MPAVAPVKAKATKAEAAVAPVKEEVGWTRKGKAPAPAAPSPTQAPAPPVPVPSVSSVPLAPLPAAPAPSPLYTSLSTLCGWLGTSLPGEAGATQADRVQQLLSSRALPTVFQQLLSSRASAAEYSALSSLLSYLLTPEGVQRMMVSCCTSSGVSADDLFEEVKRLRTPEEVQHVDVQQVLAALRCTSSPSTEQLFNARELALDRLTSSGVQPQAQRIARRQALLDALKQLEGEEDTSSEVTRKEVVDYLEVESACVALLSRRILKGRAALTQIAHDEQLSHALSMPKLLAESTKRKEVVQRETTEDMHTLTQVLGAVASMLPLPQGRCMHKLVSHAIEALGREAVPAVLHCFLLSEVEEEVEEEEETMTIPPPPPPPPAPLKIVPAWKCSREVVSLQQIQAEQASREPVVSYEHAHPLSGMPSPMRTNPLRSLSNSK